MKVANKRNANEDLKNETPKQAKKTYPRHMIKSTNSYNENDKKKPQAVQNMLLLLNNLVEVFKKEDCCKLPPPFINADPVIVDWETLKAKYNEINDLIGPKRMDELANEISKLPSPLAKRDLEIYKDITSMAADFAKGFPTEEDNNEEINFYYLHSYFGVMDSLENELGVCKFKNLSGHLLDVGKWEEWMWDFDPKSDEDMKRLVTVNATARFTNQKLLETFKTVMSDQYTRE
eukprot:2131039-Rhodomonas_salina.1